MPESLTIGTPPSTSIKRQRSQESRDWESRSASAGPARSDGSNDGAEGQVAGRATVAMPSFLNKTKQEISSAFQDLEWKQRYRLFHAVQNPESSPFRIDRSQTVIKRNRYGNVFPWDASRVKLKHPIGGSDYVNASPITLRSRYLVRKDNGQVGDAPGQPAMDEMKYVATQGPQEGQFSHFWHMVMQETTGDVGVIIMLTQLFEGNKEKCGQYFPLHMDHPRISLPAHEDDPADERDETATTDGTPLETPDAHGSDTGAIDPDANPGTESGSVQLQLLSHDASIGCEVRRLELTIDGVSKEIYHYLFNGWPDFGKPEAEDRKRLLELTRVSRRMAGRSPRIVHCSAGVGRTGTWIALDFLLRELEEGKLSDSSYLRAGTPSKANSSSTEIRTWGHSGPPKVSTPDTKDNTDPIYETVNKLREQRMMMVMNELQYSFLYELLKEAFVEKHTEEESNPAVIIEEPSPKVARKQDPFGGMYEGTRIGTVVQDEDTVSEEDTGSEIDADAMDPDKKEDQQDEEDPYAAVAPETIQEGIQETQTEGHDHEPE